MIYSTELRTKWEGAVSLQVQKNRMCPCDVTSALGVMAKNRIESPGLYLWSLVQSYTVNIINICLCNMLVRK
jgi:hypothetical protein